MYLVGKISCALIGAQVGAVMAALVGVICGVTSHLPEMLFLGLIGGIGLGYWMTMDPVYRRCARLLDLKPRHRKKRRANALPRVLVPEEA